MLCLRYAKGRAQTEDYLQDGFMQVFRDLKQFDISKGSLQGWVRKVILNKTLMQLRKKQLQFASGDVSEYANQVSGSENIISMLSAKWKLLTQTGKIFSLDLAKGYILRKYFFIHCS